MSVMNKKQQRIFTIAFVIFIILYVYGKYLR